TTETVNESANFSQHSNAIIMQEIKSALADVGVNANEIETVAYYLYPVKEYDKDGNVILSGYKTVHSVKITSYDLNKAGAIIDTVVAAGANRIDSVVFGLTDEERDKYKAIVVNSSIDNAKQKAESMAMRMGVRVTKVKHFSESSVYISPYPRFEKDFFTAAPSTEITPGQIEVSASIEVVYKIE
ncbi:MAG: SIMPL domain-containing protein, partial [Candidatus Micrarchaeia archaeon]